MFLGRFRRKESVDRRASGPPVTEGSRFQDSSDDDGDDFILPPRGIDGGFEHTESLPPTSPNVLRKRGSFSLVFRHGLRKPPRNEANVAKGVVPGSDREGDVESGHQRSKSESVYSKRTGKEKRFQGLRKLFRIKE